MIHNAPSVLMVSIDALKPEFVLNQEKLGISLPTLSGIFENGAYASEGLKSVFPTFTYTCHQSIITGTYPDTHGTYSNLMFDPDGTQRGAWNWFVSDRVPTLWKLAKDNGYCSASVYFPTSLGAQGDYIVPEFWWNGSSLDNRFVDALSKPQGLASEMKTVLGKLPGGSDLTLDGDKRRKECASWLVRNKLKQRLDTQPFFLTSYFASYDMAAHLHGAYSKEALEVLQQVDAILGELILDVYQATHNNAIICVVSDHGILDNQFCINPNVLLKQAGLITLDDNHQVSEWKAWSQRSGGTCEIHLKNPNDQESAEKLSLLLDRIQKDESSGVLEVLTGTQARKQHRGYPEADYVIIAKKGYEIRDAVTGDYLSTSLPLKAQHGYSEDFKEMRASLFIMGPGIPVGKDIGAANLVDIAPTLSALMGFDMPTAEGQSLIERIGWVPNF